MMIRTIVQLLWCCVLATLGCTAYAHTSIAPDNSPYGFNQRVVLEGTTGVTNAINISHGCAVGEGAAEARAVTALSIVFPNGPQAIATRGDTRETLALSEVIEGNPIMAPTAIQDRNIFRSIELRQGPVPQYHNHGSRDADTRAIHYSHGYLQTNLMGRVPFVANFPRFLPDSCIAKMTLRVAIANYCTFSTKDGDRADIWMGSLTEKFNDESITSLGFWPTLEVVRDFENNPLPAGCGAGFSVVVQPASSDIDEYLPLEAYWPATGGFDAHWRRK